MVLHLHFPLCIWFSHSANQLSPLLLECGASWLLRWPSGPSSLNANESGPRNTESQFPLRENLTLPPWVKGPSESNQLWPGDWSWGQLPTQQVWWRRRRRQVLQENDMRPKQMAGDKDKHQHLWYKSLLKRNYHPMQAISTVIRHHYDSPQSASAWLLSVTGCLLLQETAFSLLKNSNY